MLPAFRLPLSPVLGNVEDYVRAKEAPIPRGSLSWPKMVNPRSALSQCPAPPSPCPTPPPIVMPGLVPGIQAPTARSCPGRTTTGAASTETSRAGPPRMTTQGTGCAQYQWQDCETNPIRRNALIPCPVRTHAAGEQERRPPPPSLCPDLFRASKRPRHGLVPTGVPFDDGSGRPRRRTARDRRAWLHPASGQRIDFGASWEAPVPGGCESAGAALRRVSERRS